jgi:hypothetical protein
MTVAATTGPTPKIPVSVVPDARTAAVSFFLVSRIWVSMSETKGQAAACPDRTQAIPCMVRAVTEQFPRSGICAE